MSLTRKILYGMVLGIVVGLILNLVFPEAFEFVNGYIFYPIGTEMLEVYGVGRASAGGRPAAFMARAGRPIANSFWW